MYQLSNRVAKSGNYPPDSMQAGRNLLLASTMEPVEAGLLDLLENAFYQSSNILVRHIAVGSGRALEIASNGRVDIVLTHAPKLEEQFIEEGWGLSKVPLMANDYILVGPSSDPAKLKFTENNSVTELFKKIAFSESPFISRGDQSGTYLREQEIWEAAGTNPAGNWYKVFSGVAGNLGILRMAAEISAYTLVDRASYLLAQSNESLTIYASKENISDGSGHSLLNNTFVLTLVNPERVPNVNYQDATIFAQWLQQEGKSIIAAFGTEKFGEPLFSLVEDNIIS